MAVRFPKDFRQENQQLWTSPLAPPIPYSEGADAEEYLVKTLSSTQDLSSTSTELESKIVDWSSEYHLSPLRANLLRPIKLKPNSRILEVGSGCGAITRYLGEQGYKVTALEGSLKRAQISQLRCRDLENVQIVNADVWDIEFEEKFDVITLIGVLEYAARYGANHDQSDFSLMIEWTKKFLKPGGLLVVAIENKFGLKYLSGCPEDHSGRLFEGIEGYYQPESVRTFGKTELTSLLSSAGFTQTKFFLPFPDYKIPSVMLAGSDSYLNFKQDFNLSGWCDMPFESYGPRRRFFISDQLAIREFEKNGLLDEVANSFLVLATTSNDFSQTAFDPTQDWIAKKINLNRNRNFQTVTTLTFQDGPTILKEKFRKESPDSASASLALSHKKKEAYLCGREKLSLELLRAARHSDMDQTAFWDLFRRYHSYLISCADEEGNLPADSIDLLPFNIMINTDGSLRGFDYEWVCDKKVSLKRVLFRGAITFFNRERRWLKNLKERPVSSIGFAKLVFKRLHIQLTHREIQKFVQEEVQFQELAGSRESPARQTLKQAFATYLSENFTKPLSMCQDALQLLWQSPYILRGKYFLSRYMSAATVRIPKPSVALPQRGLIKSEHSPWSQKLRRLFLIDHVFLLENLVARNLKVKYRRSFFGFFWTLLHPLLSGSVYYFLFKQVAKLDIPNYGAFVVVSNIPWTFFSQSVIEAAECMVNSRDLLRKIYCPREVFPMSSVITNFVTFLLSLPVIAVFAYLGGGRLDITLLALIPVSLLTLFFAHVFGLLLSVLYVFFRDVKHLIGIMTQILFFATPVVYEPHMVPESFRFILILNPMATLIPAYRDILLKNVWPDWMALANSCVIVGLIGVVAYNVFAQYNRAIPEYV